MFVAMVFCVCSANFKLVLRPLPPLPLTPGILIYIGSLMKSLGAIRATLGLHHSVLLNVLASPMSFFDMTPIGRVVNRFSKDVDVLDTVIPMIIGMFLGCLLQTVSTIFVISVATPMFLVCILPLMVFYSFVQVLPLPQFTSRLDGFEWLNELFFKIDLYIRYLDTDTHMGQVFSQSSRFGLY